MISTIVTESIDLQYCVTTLRGDERHTMMVLDISAMLNAEHIVTI